MFQFNLINNFDNLTFSSSQKSHGDHINRLRKFIAKPSAGLRIRIHPTLQSEQIGVVPVEVFFFRFFEKQTIKHIFLNFLFFKKFRAPSTSSTSSTTQTGFGCVWARSPCWNFVTSLITGELQKIYRLFIFSAYLKCIFLKTVFCTIFS